MATDDFDRADAGTLGANWTDQRGSIDIVSNEAKSTVINTEYAFYSGVVVPDNQFSQIICRGVSATGYNGLTARASVAEPNDNESLADGERGAAVDHDVALTVDNFHVEWCSAKV